MANKVIPHVPAPGSSIKDKAVNAKVNVASKVKASPASKAVKPKASVKK